MPSTPRQRPWWDLLTSSRSARGRTTCARAPRAERCCAGATTTTGNSGTARRRTALYRRRFSGEGRRARRVPRGDDPTCLTALTRRSSSTRVSLARTPLRLRLSLRSLRPTEEAAGRRDGPEGRDRVGTTTRRSTRSYSWGKAERARMFDEPSFYHQVHRRSKVYVDGALEPASSLEDTAEPPLPGTLRLA